MSLQNNSDINQFITKLGLAKNAQSDLHIAGLLRNELDAILARGLQKPGETTNDTGLSR